MYNFYLESMAWPSASVLADCVHTDTSHNTVHVCGIVPAPSVILQQESTHAASHTLWQPPPSSSRLSKRLAVRPPPSPTFSPSLTPCLVAPPPGAAGRRCGVIPS